MVSQGRKHTGPYCSRFGTIAVEFEFLTIEQLKWALDVQVADDCSGRPHRVIGAICFDHGWMTPEQIDLVLNHMFNARRQRSQQAHILQEQAI